MSSKDDKLKWLIDRSDQLRAAVAAGAGTLVSSIAIIMTGLSVFMTYVVQHLPPTTAEHLWSTRIF